MPDFPPATLAKINSWHELPVFDDEDEEVAFWLTHQLDARLMNNSIQISEVRESTTITLRFDPRLLSRIKRIARSRFLNYQSMMKQWISERLENERR